MAEYLAELNKTLDLLDKGEKANFVKEKYKDVTLVLGMTGSGKSTFLQWLFGDNRQLTSLEVSMGEFIIVDNDFRISNSTIISKTLYPELVVDPDTNAAYYDCPGFSDTRGASTDIANSFFIRKITENAQSIRIILTVDYSAVKSGGDRKTLMNLLLNLIKFIKKLDNYKSSIGLVVTKVDNAYYYSNGKFILLADQQVKKNIAKFLKAVKDDLPELSKLNPKQLSFHQNAEELIDMFLTKVNDDYNKIMLFRRPDTSGPLSKISLLQDAKPLLKKNIKYKFPFAKKHSVDFGYSISDDSKVVLLSLVNTVNDQTWNEFSQITQKIQEYFNEVSENVDSEINKLVGTTTMGDISNISSHYANTIFVLDFFTNLKQAGDKNLNLEYVSQQIRVLIKSVKIKDLNNLDDISKNFEYLNFFELLSDRVLPQRPWIDIIKLNLQNMKIIKSKFDNTIKTNGIEKLLNQSKNMLEEFQNFFNINLQNKIQSVHIRNASLAIKELNKWIEKLIELIQNEKHNEIKVLLPRLGHISPNDIKNILQIYFNYHQIKYLCNLNKIFNSYCNDNYQYIISLKKLEQKTVNIIEWYTFLNSLLENLSDYKFQENKKTLSTSDSSGFSLGTVTKVTFKKFMEKIKNFGYSYSYNFNNITDIDEFYFEDLNRILRYNLRPLSVFSSNKGNIIITGNILTSAELTNEITKDYAFIDIFVRDIFYVDADINLTEKNLQLNIISPKWVVIGTRKFNLDGNPGQNLVTENMNGEDGNPGGPGGNFFGLAMETENIGNLTIYANGGRGGNGQHGRPGNVGKDGRNAEDNSSFGSIEVKDPTFMIAIVYNEEHTYYKYFGNSGEVGGIGGNGGAAGIGGRGGIVQFRDVKKNSVPLVINSSGAAGTYGKGGPGGEGGKNGNDLLVTYCMRMIFLLPYQHSACKKTVDYDNSRAQTGNVGNSGLKKLNPKTPKENIPFENPNKTVSHYKIHFQKDVENRFSKNNLRDFFDLNYLNDTIKSPHRARRSINYINNNKPVVSSAGKTTFLLTDIKNYLMDKIGAYFDWNKSDYNLINSYVDSPGVINANEKKNIVSGVHYDLNETILLAQLFSHALLKDKKIIQNVQFSSPSDLQQIEASNLAKHILPLLDEAYIRYNE